MANHRIRRSSMENLHLLDLDRLTIDSSSRKDDQPPPLPPPRHHLRSSLIEHSRALYDITRAQNDPLYAKTPMFTTIPRTQPEFFPRQILGARIPADIIQRNSSPSTPSTPETPKKSEDADDERDDRSNPDTDKDDDKDKDNDDDDDDDHQSSSSSSSDDSKNRDNDDDILNDDDDKKAGVVEQIFNRDKRK